LTASEAVRVLDEDVAYLDELRARRLDAQPPPGRRGPVQRELHERNAAAL
jgi:hypothetical protein